jgi:choline-sulfatase
MSGAFRLSPFRLPFCLLPFAFFLCLSCSRPPATPRARNLVLITIDTLRADRVGAYGYGRARTPRLDALAASGVVFEHAYAAAPVTLPSHATILTGLYPPGHGARDNGMKMSEKPSTLATDLKARGFRTAAFVAAFPLDHQFGLARGFDAYGDRLPRDASGRQANERPAAEVVTEAIAWLQSAPSQAPHPAPGTAHPAPSTQHSAPGGHPFFLWLHLFEPHAPYEGDPSRPVADRYDEEIATADRELGRLLDALGEERADTLIVATGDHGEAFGEHGEYSHSIFIYDTTLRVPLIMAGPGLAPRRVADAVTLADVAPTAIAMLGFNRDGAMPQVDGIDLSSAAAGQPIGQRELYAESFAPLVEFGWAPLRSIRAGAWKYIAAPTPELYDLARDAGEQHNVVDANGDAARGLSVRVGRYSNDALAGASSSTGEAAQRLRALGYSAGSSSGASTANRVDPKDRRELAARLAQVTSGELHGAALRTALDAIVRDDPRNGQAHLRLGYAHVEAGDCTRAEPEFHAAIANGLPSTDAFLGLAGCLGGRNDFAGAERALSEALRLEPENPVIIANIGIVKASRGDVEGAVRALTSALAAEPNLHQARFNLALTYARAGRKSDALSAARELLRRLPANAPQRSEVERLLHAVEAM